MVDSPIIGPFVRPSVRHGEFVGVVPDVPNSRALLRGLAEEEADLAQALAEGVLA